MKTLATTLTSLILAGWMGAAAILAVQNFSPVSFKLLTVQTIEIPFGVVLAFSAGVGAIGTAIAPVLFGPIAGQEDED
ncbi:MAG: DUF1049 domain-containing protein [Leptolyngbyaceae cyanobacterium bins.302]|nr:DUF1049 domain-containing protein [Leptolyngbyaceae cyanobacterium bins.302]